MINFGMRKLASALLVSISIFLVFTLAAPRQASAWQIDVPLNQALVLEGGESTNPRQYDPHTTFGSGDKRVFSGLVAFDPQLNLTPDLAEKWDVSTDGMTYTFHLHQNAKFHNGRAVTAQDVLYSLERAASPALVSDTALTYLGDIVGVHEYNSRKADHIAGLKVIDDHAIQITIDAPKPYFLLKLTYPTAFILDKENVDSGADWYRHPNGTGPYKLIEWTSFKRQQYIDVVDLGRALPAIGIYPPGLPGFNIALKGLPYDPAQARELLKQSKYGLNLPPIVFTNGGTGSYVGADVAALAQMWKQNLGVTITIENLEPNFYYDQIYKGNHGQLFDGGWCADYPDPENFADVLFHTGSNQNNGGCSQPPLCKHL